MCLLSVCSCIKNSQEFRPPTARLNRLILKQARDLILYVELLTVTFLLIRGWPTSPNWDETELLIRPEEFCLVNSHTRWIVLKVKSQNSNFKSKKFVKILHKAHHHPDGLDYCRCNRQSMSVRHSSTSQPPTALQYDFLDKLTRHSTARHSYERHERQWRPQRAL